MASVRAQHLLPRELVVVDDGRGAKELVRELSLPFPVCVLSTPGLGPGGARNAGLREAGGEWVAFLDDDDVWHPCKLAWQAEALQAHPEVGALGTDQMRETGPEPHPPGRLRYITRERRCCGRIAW